MISPNPSSAAHRITACSAQKQRHSVDLLRLRISFKDETNQCISVPLECRGAYSACHLMTRCAAAWTGDIIKLVRRTIGPSGGAARVTA